MLYKKLKKNFRVNEKLKFFLGVAVVYFIFSLVEMLFAFGSVKAIGFSIFFLIGNIALCAAAFLGLLFCVITSKKRNKFDFIAVSLVILGATIMICSFGNAERSTALPHYYWSIDKYFVALYSMSKYSNVTEPTLVSSQIIVNFNIIFSTIMLILFFIFNLGINKSKVL